MDKKNINDEFETLIKEFNNIKIIKNEPTFMEISKYPHYENVCSNILEFFFNDEIHNLNNLFIKTILELISEKNEYNLDLIQSKRELYTKKGKRIDLFLEYDEFTITIENKINAPLNNDLKDYENTINLNYKNKKNYFIVLSLNKESKIDSKIFQNLTYKKLINNVKNNLNKYLSDANQKYLNYLIDFLKSIENQYINKKMKKEIIEFIKKNEENLESLFEQSTNLKKNFELDIDRLKKEIKSKKFDLIKPIGIYKGDDYSYFAITLYLDFKLKDLNFAIDINRKLDGWEVIIFTRNNNHKSKFNNIINKNINSFSIKKNKKIKNERFLIYNFKEEITVQEIAVKIKILLDNLNKEVK